MADFERITELTPAWDRRSDDPSENYGIHGVGLRMILKGPKGAVQFCVSTNWHLPHVQDEHRAKIMTAADPARDARLFFEPTPADVGYHSPEPVHDWQEPVSEDCPYVEGGTCYYDGSGLRAVEWFTTLLEEGSDGIWRLLEEDYEELFGEDLREKPRISWLHNECLCESPVVARQVFLLSGPDGVPWCQRCGFRLPPDGEESPDAE